MTTAPPPTNTPMTDLLRHLLRTATAGETAFVGMKTPGPVADQATPPPGDAPKAAAPDRECNCPVCTIRRLIPTPTQDREILDASADLTACLRVVHHLGHPDRAPELGFVPESDDELMANLHATFAGGLSDALAGLQQAVGALVVLGAARAGEILPAK